MGLFLRFEPVKFPDFFGLDPEPETGEIENIERVQESEFSQAIVDWQTWSQVPAQNRSVHIPASGS